jgi:ParB-like chromosome segregation protein Spo0J
VEELGTKEVPIGKLQLPGDMASRMKKKHVKERAESIQKFGLIEPVLVRKSDMKLISGRDRTAAHMLLEEKTIVARLVDCTDEECEDLDDETNIQRRHDPAEQARLVKKRVEAEAKRLLAENPALPPAGKGKPNARSLAREKVAQQRGVKPDSIRRTQARHEAKERGSTPPPKAPSNFEAFGLQLEDSWLQEVESVRDIIDSVVQRLGQAKAGLSGLAESKLPFHSGMLQAARRDLDELSEDVKGMRPSRLCPYCKGQEKYSADCKACLGACYITKSQDQSIPAKLDDQEHLHVMHNGKTVELAPKRKGRRELE